MNDSKRFKNKRLKMHVSKNKSDSLMLKVYASKTLKELHSRMLA